MKKKSKDKLILSKRFLSTYLLLGLVALFAIITLVFDNPLREKEREDRIINQPLISDFNQELMTKIVISQNQKDVSLEKRDSTWYVKDGEDYPADSNLIGTMLNDIAGLKRENISSKDPSQHSYFQVTKETGITVALFDSSGLKVQFYLGKNGEPSWNDQYFRLEGEDITYKTSGSVKRDFSYSVDDIKDKRLFALSSFDRTRAIELAVKYDFEKISVIAGEAGFQLTSPKSAEVNAKKFDDFLAKLMNLKAASFTNEPKESLGLSEDAEKIKIFVKLNDNSSYILRLAIKKDDPDFYYAEISGNKMIFKLEKSAAESLKIKPEDLIGN